MKSFVEKYLPWLLILLGGLRLLWERYPSRVPFLRILGGTRFGWIFWLCGITGILWLFLRSSDEGEEIREKPVSSKQSALRRFFKNYGIEMLILLMTAASLSMLFRSGFYWDDAVNSTVYLAQKKDQISTWQHVLDFMAEYLHLGRINVLSIYYYFFFYIENVSVYKALIILSILADQLILRRVLLAFGVPLSGARMGMLLMPMLLQTRAYQDPVSGFYSLMQLLTAEMLLCAMFLQRWLHSGRGLHLALSLLLFGMGLMTYEVCFPFLLMICLLILVNRGTFGKAVRGSLPFVVLTILMLLGVAAVRSRFVTQGTYEGVAFSLSPAAVLRTAFRQFTAGLPLSYYSAAYQASVLDNAYPAAGFMSYDFLSFLSAVRFSDVLIAVGCLYVFFQLWKSRKNDEDLPSQKAYRALLVLGLSFAVLPVVTVAVSERYQGQLMPGLGYLPVYMQYYGIAVLMVLLMLRFREKTAFRAVFLSFFLLVVLLNLQNNRAVTEIMNRSFYEPRLAGETALRGGILDFMPQDAVLISVNDRRYLWEANWNNAGLYEQFYGNNSRHLPAVVGDNRLLREAVNDLLSVGAEADEEGWLVLQPEEIWVIDYFGTAGRGFARLGKLRYALVNTATLELRDMETDRVLYFISGSYPEKTDVHYTAADGTFVQLHERDQMRIRRTGDGMLCQLPDGEEILFESLSLR